MAAIHDLAERRIRDLPLFEYRVELRLPRVRVACPQCGPKLEQLSWLAPYARVTTRLAESVGRLCAVMALRHGKSQDSHHFPESQDRATSVPQQTGCRRSSTKQSHSQDRADRIDPGATCSSRHALDQPVDSKIGGRNALSPQSRR
jgi:hypothetical protein